MKLVEDKWNVRLQHMIGTSKKSEKRTSRNGFLKLFLARFRQFHKFISQSKQHEKLARKCNRSVNLNSCPSFYELSNVHDCLCDREKISMKKRVCSFQLRLK